MDDPRTLYRSAISKGEIELTVYAVGTITITDPATYNRYRDAFSPVLERYSGRALAADESPLVEEGEWPFSKLILLEFADEPSYRRWMNSPEYQEIVKDRHAGSRGTVVLVRGLDSR